MKTPHKNIIVCFYTLVFAVIIIHQSLSQIKAIDGSSSLNELKFIAQNKLLNQFIKRFNGEESKSGYVIYPNEKNYRNKKLRKQSFDMLFDYQINDKVKIQNFMKLKKKVLNTELPFFMSLGKKKIISELKVEVYYKKKIYDMTLFLKLQKEKVGSKWVIFKVDFPEFDREFKFDHKQTEHFLHPLSHEIGFVNLNRIAEEKNKIELLVDNSVTMVDHLTLFLNHIKNGTMQIHSVGKLEYHIFQVSGFYFNVKYVNRDSHNAGWLIQDIVMGNDDEMKVLKDFILQ